MRKLTEVIDSLNHADWSRCVLQTVTVQTILLVEVLFINITHKLSTSKYSI